MSDSNQRVSWWPRIALAGFALLIAFVGGVWAFRGVQAVRKGELDLEWRAAGGLHVGPAAGAGQRQGTVQYRGFEAVVFGTGLAGLGVMLLTLGLGLARAFPRPQDPPGVPGRPGLILALVSFAGLMVGIAGVFAPWRLLRDPSAGCFYAGMSGWVALGWLASKKIIPQLLSRSGVVILVLAPLFGWLHSTGAAVGFLLALLAMVFLVAHLQYLHAAWKGIPPFRPG